MTRKRKSQFMRVLEERRDEAARERAQAQARAREEAAEEAGEAANEPSEDKVLRERAPFLLPTRPRRRQWK